MSNRYSALLSYLLVILYLFLCGFIVFKAPARAAWPQLFGASLLATAVLIGIYKLGHVGRPLVLGIAIALRLFFLPLEPTLSDDAYRYIWDGAVSAEGINPYLYRPDDPELAEFSDDPIYELINSKAYYTVYPPVSQAYFWVGGQFYANGWLWSYYAIKIALVVTEILALVLLASLTSPLLLLLYAWHPLVLMETAGQAHTESAMLLFLLLCVWLVKQKRGGLASIALAFAGWIKLYPFVFFPLLWRRFRWKGLVPGGITTVLLLLPFYHENFFSNINDSLNLYVRFFEFNAGVYYGIKEVFLWWTGDDWSKQLGPFLRVLFLLGLPCIYALDYWRRWPIEKSFLIIIGFFLLMSTTIHPWYFLGILLLLVISERPAWHWYWVASFSIGTYLLYIDGPYWPIVVTGWIGWLFLGIYHHRNKPAEALQEIQQVRAEQKVQHVEALLGSTPRNGIRVLDLGAGEGYVGDAVSRRWQGDVMLVDVCDMNRTTLPHYLYDGENLQLPDNAFDVTLLYFVLHHSEKPERVLSEALRVTRGNLIIVESVYEENWDLRLLTFLDILANRLRSGGLMNAQEEHLHFRKAPAWKALINQLGGRVIVEHRKGEWLHKQHTFVVHKHASRQASIEFDQ